jgi:hypothetical protein
VTHRSPRPVTNWALLRTLTVLTVAVALPVTYAGAASADVPQGWSDPEPVDFMHTLLVFVGIPLLVIVLVALAVYLPSIVRGESIAPAGIRPDDEWFGGRADAELAIEARKVGVGADETGGASGSW